MDCYATIRNMIEPSQNWGESVKWLLQIFLNVPLFRILLKYDIAQEHF
jgi:hypothetical protein